MRAPLNGGIIRNNGKKIVPFLSASGINQNILSSENAATMVPAEAEAPPSSSDVIDESEEEVILVDESKMLIQSLGNQIISEIKDLTERVTEEDAEKVEKILKDVIRFLKANSRVGKRMYVETQDHKRQKVV